MSRHRVIGGVVVTTPEGVFEHYRPDHTRISEDVWHAIRPTAVAAARAADYASVAAALAALGATTYFLAWAHRQDIPLDLESAFVPSHVERYCATQLSGLASETRSTRRGYLRRVGRACTTKAPWAPPPKPFAENVVLLPPYSPEEVAGFWHAAESQRTEHRTRVATVILTLGLGAGVKPHEMLVVTASDHVRLHPSDPRLVAVVLESRTVPVLARYAERLLALCQQYPEGPLVGAHDPQAKDPLGSLRAGIRWPQGLPAFRPARLRTTWMAEVLAQDVRISEFMHISGTVSAKSLETIAPHVAARWEDDAYLFKAAGL